jgi:tRNA pseudouridine32 synthase/23S rRNA pseudouridine746 synthase
MSRPVYENSAFSPFEDSAKIKALARGLIFSLDNPIPHPLCLLAVDELQLHLQHQQEWNHSFGLLSGAEGTVIGKMFGVLVVRTKQGKLGYLSAFSGKLAGKNHYAKFVPPIFDGLAEGGFLNAGMEKLSHINEKIRVLESLKQKVYIPQIDRLKAIRKVHSAALQDKIFDQYHFLNKAGKSKSLIETFQTVVGTKPPAGAGECAAPKLLQYAFRNEMEPLALAEFWWGGSTKSTHWKHGHFYPPCKEKCAPILAHMLTLVRP